MHMLGPVLGAGAPAEISAGPTSAVRLAEPGPSDPVEVPSRTSVTHIRTKKPLLRQPTRNLHTVDAPVRSGKAWWRPWAPDMAGEMEHWGGRPQGLRWRLCHHGCEANVGAPWLLVAADLGLPIRPIPL